jgi:hypothetical protein
MSLPPDQLPLSSPPTKPKLTSGERRGIGAALGMPAAEAISLLTRHQWCEGSAMLLRATAARLGVQVPS